MVSDINRKFMMHAISLAEKGGGHTHPNPLVGAVIVRGGVIIAEGYHHNYGNLHAERDAIKNALDGKVDVAGSEMYVTLEPCCHQGKQPPCTDAIIGAGIKKVYVGSSDPNPLVAGGGIMALRNAGIEVVENVCREECDRINRIFFHYIKTGMPYVILKYAMTADGKSSLSTGESKWISNEKSRKYVHHLRGTTSCVLAGISTVLKDDPLLNCRIEDSMYRQPARVIVDARLQIPFESKLLKTAKEIPLVVFTSSSDSEKIRKIEALGARVEKCRLLENNHVDMKHVLERLGSLSYDSVLVESGGKLNASLIFENLFDRLLVFVAPKIFGGQGGIVHSPVQGREADFIRNAVFLSKPSVTFFDDDIMLEYEKCSQE